jgi:hypothetical protein
MGICFRGRVGVRVSVRALESGAGHYMFECVIAPESVLNDTRGVFREMD